MMKKIFIGLAACLMVSAAVIAPAQATTTITDANDGSAGPATSVGGQNTFIGQSFTASKGYDILNDFTYYLTYSEPFTYKAYIYQVTNTYAGTLLSNALYTSDAINSNGGTILTNVGAVSLVDGNTYVALISSNGLTNKYGDTVGESITSAKGFSYTSSTVPVAGLNASEEQSLGFLAHFNNAAISLNTALNDTVSVPEPASMVGLLGLSFLGLLAARRIRPGSLIEG